jgi:hypothetical protein
MSGWRGVASAATAIAVLGVLEARGPRGDGTLQARADGDARGFVAPVPAARRGATAALVIGARHRLLDLFTLEGGPVVPGPVPRGLGGVEPADCASCHAEIAAEWANSVHARAWTDPIFQAEYRLGPDAFCRRCHAPLVRDDGEPPARATGAGPGFAPRLGASGPGPGADAEAGFASLAARGIDCAVCHVREGRVLGGHGRGDGDHATRRDARLLSSAFCGSCHQFDFPRPRAGQPVRYHPGQPLQNTLVEWTQSRYADRACQDCHMPRVAAAGLGTRSHRSHAFRTFEDRVLMARAVVVKANARRRGGELHVTVSIAPGEIGHGFPTGDMFREAVLTVRAGAAQRRQVLRRYFAPVITADGRGHLLGQVDDTRLVPAGTASALRFSFRFDEPSGADAPAATEVLWSLDLARLALDDARSRGLEAAAIVIPVQRGRVPVGD